MTDIPTPTPVSPEAATLLEAGAAPVQPDLAALQAQIAAMETKYAALLAASGIPGDPIAAGVANLVAHVEARAAQSPSHDFSELLKTLKNLPETVDAKAAELVRMATEDVANAGKHLELGYLPELARNLYREVVKAA